MSLDQRSTPEPGPDHPYAAEIAAERQRWHELVDLVRSLTPEEWIEPGYQSEPDWTVRDVVAHVGTWLAEAQLQFQRMSAGTYEGHDVDIDALNAALLAGMQGQPWEVAWVQANSGRTMMLHGWYELSHKDDEAAWWIRKSGAEHYADHLGRLREWVADVTSRRDEASD